MRSTYWCEKAWLGDDVVDGVLVEVGDTGVIREVSAVDSPPSAAHQLRGVVLPGMANAHSHAFHRALRGRGAGAKGTFWTWRKQMYRLASKIDPDSYRRLATGVYAEMVQAGITCVGEFHYLHHPAGGGRYEDPNAMSEALVQAAADAGIRLTLLDTCYLSGGFGAPVEGVQVRYADSDVDDWLQRVQQLDVNGHRVRLGAALHSVRAVPSVAIPTVVEWARHRGAPLHVHLSEQRAENEACLGAHGCTPTQLLDTHGALGPSTTAIHATHLAAADTALLGGSNTGVCLCPTTEADLADGIGPATALTAAGSPLSLGSDGQTVIDLFAEAQAVENTMRLSTETRGHFSGQEAISMATLAGHRTLGWTDAGWIGPGARADLISVDLDSVRLAGVPPQAVIAHAGSGDVRDVVVDGRLVVADRTHRTVPDVAARLRTEIEALWVEAS